MTDKIKPVRSARLQKLHDMTERLSRELSGSAAPMKATWSAWASDPALPREPDPGVSFDMHDPTGWKLTSVRWIYDNHRSYIVGTDQPAHQMLERAMRRMGYLAADSEALMRREPEKWIRGETAYTAQMARLQGELIDCALSHWDALEHERMLKFIAEGGVEARREVLGLEVSKKATFGAFDLGKKKPEDKPKVGSTKAKPPVLEQSDEEIIDAEEKAQHGNAW